MEQIKRAMYWRGEAFHTFDSIFKKALELARQESMKNDAIELFNCYVDYIKEASRTTREDALQSAKNYFGFYAGYYDRETEDIVNKVFDAYHPMFGGRNSHDVDPKEVFKLGQKFEAQQKAENEAKKQ